ncbi:WD40 repeat-like protein [Xylaria bambusicola]|uniref:WD40 repeat-like protein n=1 Tax=Xylaria bambusicola TaxID=326684 RepID=UPI002008DF31|nr:WD40 repeat-like protein [Xylaria bambusicola]KAI0518417.1 WD40 repeat-like protein [Xylaria bambusicola]
MASNGHMSTASPLLSNVIDLTQDDTDTDTAVNKNPTRYDVPVRGLPYIGPDFSHPTPKIHATDQPRTPRQDEDGDRPSKRQRTGDLSPTSNGFQRQEVTAALEKCLDEQVFPYIDRAAAAAQLSPANYDLDGLGAEVIRTVVNRDFKRYFLEGNGRLDRKTESTIAAGIHRLVIELSRKYHRLAPKLSSTPIVRSSDAGTDAIHDRLASISVPKILPSIEKGVGYNDDDRIQSESDDVDVDVQNYNSTENNDLDDGDDHGYDSDAPGFSHEGVDERDLSHARDEFMSRAAEHTPLKHRPPKKPVLSPQQLRTRAKASQWQSGKTYNSISTETKRPRSFGLSLRPYLSALERQQTIAGVSKATLPAGRQLPQQVFHVDFCDAEIYHLQQLARKIYGKPNPLNRQRSTLRDLRNLVKKVPSMKTELARIHTNRYAGYDSPPLVLKTRSSRDVENFLNDLHSKRLNTISSSLFIEQNNERNSIAQSQANRANKIPALMLLREVTGNRLGAARTYQNFITTVKSNREDYLEPQVEWTNCAGDIMTVSWISDTDFICGATTHSDAHNQQYNKPGNLLLGSAVNNTLRAYPDHRIIRPVVSSGDNALESMVASQDPWLFTSVVSSDYDPSCGLAFTSSFDKTVKVWKPENDSVTAVGTWNHDGRVNFVVASKNEMHTVATAADVPTEAVRVYHIENPNVDEPDFSSSRYDSYSCTRVHDEDYVPSEKWAYYPAAIRWGLALEVKHLLLIGYSPRSPTGEDHEIPEDKRNSGELCLWDTKSRTQVKVSSAKTQNVFEVVWHPSRASFAAATSASQVLEKTDQTIRTQIRIFEFNVETGQYGAIKTLDCPAIDVNELSIMPNSLLYSYIAASCTDGKVYVWDSAASDLSMCVLEHGAPIEELLGERDEEDVGVKFAAWATTPDRLYTGSSDGVVKVWNIRHGQGVLVKDLMEASAPITYGAFSPDFTRLIIGDGSGRVYLLALEDTEDEDPPPNPTGPSAGFLSVKTSSGNERAVRRPRPFIPHPEVPPPHTLMEGQETARGYLQDAQIVLHSNPTIGAIKGVNYAATGLFRLEAHVNEDSNEPLLANFQSKQQEAQPDSINPKLPRQLEQIDEGLVNGWHDNQSAGRLAQGGSDSNDDDDSNPKPNYPDFLDHATYLALIKEKAELDDSLVELQYETSIADSDEDDEEDDDNTAV